MSLLTMCIASPQWVAVTMSDLKQYLTLMRLAISTVISETRTQITSVVRIMRT